MDIYEVIQIIKESKKICLVISCYIYIYIYLGKNRKGYMRDTITYIEMIIKLDLIILVSNCSHFFFLFFFLAFLLYRQFLTYLIHKYILFLFFF